MKSPAVVLAFGSKPKKDEVEEPTGESSDYDEGEEAAADAAFDALKSGDKAAFKDALGSYVRQCVSREMSSGEE